MFRKNNVRPATDPARLCEMEQHEIPADAQTVVICHPGRKEADQEERTHGQCTFTV